MTRTSPFRLRPHARRALLASATVLALVAGGLLTLDAQVRPVYSLGASGVLQQIQKLRTTASALHTAAHPDDEDSAFIARVARGDFGRVAYLSINRGEGGQNVIGPELFEALGVIRPEELLQARTLDGGDQIFGSTFDYGFSKTLDEAARTWGEREVLGDIVRAIRMYRPLVVYSRFSGTPADGHGQHQLMGKLTPLAFAAAADPAQFPEQLEEGLRPWQAKKLYRGVGFRPQPGNEPTTVIQTGRFAPLIGRSYFEVAAEGRSQHKSQEMGVPESRGAPQSGLIFLDRPYQCLRHRPQNSGGHRRVVQARSAPGLMWPRSRVSCVSSGPALSGLSVDRPPDRKPDRHDPRHVPGDSLRTAVQPPDGRRAAGRIGC